MNILTMITKKFLLGTWSRLAGLFVPLFLLLALFVFSNNTFAQTIKTERAAYNEDESVAFVIDGATRGEWYTFWWDGKGISSQRVQASGTTFRIIENNATRIDTGNFCMAPGNDIFVIQIGGGKCTNFATVFYAKKGSSVATAGGKGTGPTIAVTPSVTGGPRLGAGCPGGGEIDTALGCIPTNDINGFVQWFLTWAIGIGGGIAFLLILWSGFQIMTATGNPDRLKAGKEQLTSAVSGLLFIIFSVFLLKLIGIQILNLPGF